MNEEQLGTVVCAKSYFSTGMVQFVNTSMAKEHKAGMSAAWGMEMIDVLVWCTISSSAAWERQCHSHALTSCADLMH
eukprot:CAMPEP_0198112540 /NCGR_PEP_ID=MMETSP1442-20131203/4384_1 /TAXON_ID= /ORGANISM="Craspedostauros australis, Strain CCMP3328" /LENGTH=76 /DNA_ID=CAMNT_0043769351 /DNA_START=37 /DNA_END=268 /DNA_ORIENTATION=-